MTAKNIIYILVFIIVLSTAFYYGIMSSREKTAETILSFQDCELAGYPIMESYPRQCKTPDGLTFAEEIPENATYVNATEDNIKFELPYPGAVVGKEFIATGEARGMWYFEASFPIKVLGSGGELLAETYATAQGEWMTEEFVPYRSETIKIPVSYIGKATLILGRSNASGLPENDASVSIPINIEY